ncbi:MAG: DciA family protein [Sphingopyxis sp.]|nr:DciA family protein [Sphingopyxis sp.]
MAPGMAKDAGEEVPAKKAKAKGGAKSAKPPVRAYERPRGGEARMVSDLVPEIGRAAFRKFGFVQSSVVSRWREIVGDRLADVTQPAMIRFPAGQKAGGTLHLTISGAHAPMLQHVAPDIIGAVNRFFGYAAVAQVRMTHGQVTPAAPVQPPAMLKPVPAELGDSLRDIGDPELRTVLERMAAGLATPPKLPRIS